MKVDPFTGETYHLGRRHVSDCACFDEPDSEMGLRACNCDDLLNPEEPDDDNDPEELTAEESHELMDAPDMKVGALQD